MFHEYETNSVQQHIIFDEFLIEVKQMAKKDKTR